jgi:hypothetical protein
MKNLRESIKNKLRSLSEQMTTWPGSPNSRVISYRNCQGGGLTYSSNGATTIDGQTPQPGDTFTFCCGSSAAAQGHGMPCGWGQNRNGGCNYILQPQWGFNPNARINKVWVVDQVMPPGQTFPGYGGGFAQITAWINHTSVPCGWTNPNWPTTTSFDCDSATNTCSDPGTGNGQYPTMADCTTNCPSCDTTTASPCAVQWWQNPNATWAANWINNRDCSNYNWPAINLEQQALDIMNDTNNYGTNTPNPQTGPFNGFQDIWDAGNNSGLVNPHKGQFIGKMAKSKYSQCQQQACNC